jgi:hypothetical protein
VAVLSFAGLVDERELRKLAINPIVNRRIEIEGSLILVCMKVLFWHFHEQSNDRINIPRFLGFSTGEVLDYGNKTKENNHSNKKGKRYDRRTGIHPVSRVSSGRYECIL